MFDGLLQDLRYGVRALVARPGFSITALLTLALAIGANTLVFSLIDGIYLSPLPVSRRCAPRRRREPLSRHGARRDRRVHPRLSRSPRRSARARRQRAVQQRELQHRDRWRTRARARHPRNAIALFDARCLHAARPRLHGRRSAAGRRSRRRARRFDVAQPLQRGPVDRRTRRAPQRRELPRHRRHAGRLHVSGPRDRALRAVRVHRRTEGRQGARLRILDSDRAPRARRDARRRQGAERSGDPAQSRSHRHHRWRRHALRDVHEVGGFHGERAYAAHAPDRRARADAGAAAARRGTGAADCVRQHREPSADAAFGAAEGAVGSHGARCEPATHRAPAADRGRSARGDRRDARHRRRGRSGRVWSVPPACCPTGFRSGSICACLLSR